MHSTLTSNIIVATSENVSQAVLNLLYFTLLHFMIHQIKVTDFALCWTFFLSFMELPYEINYS